MPRARATEAEVARQIAAAVKAGMRPRGHEIAPDGTIRVLYALDTPAESPEPARPKRFAG